MKVALPVWDGRISPVFDTARNLLVVDSDGSVEAGRAEEALTDGFAPRRAARLADLGVNVLICGAISRPLACMVAAYGIQIVPFVNGDADEVLSSYLSGRLAEPDFPAQFRMPGCRGRGRRFRGRYGPRGRRWS